MAQKELRRMSRVELIEIIYALEQNEEELKKENEELRKKLAERTVVVEHAGSIAEAVAGLNHIFDAAQQTADDYLASVQKMKEKTEREAERAKEELMRGAREEVERTKEELMREAIEEVEQEKEKRLHQIEKDL